MHKGCKKGPRGRARGAGRGLDEAAQRTQQAERALADAEQAEGDHTGRQEALREATEARKSAAQAHQAAIETAQQANAALSALEAAPDTPAEDLQAATAERDAAVRARKQSRQALNEAKSVEADREAQVAEHGEAHNDERAGARELEQAQAVGLALRVGLEALAAAAAEAALKSAQDTGKEAAAKAAADAARVEREAREARETQLAADIDALSEQGLLTPVRPYWDPRLRHDRSARRDFIMRLYAVGLAGFRLVASGPFSWPRKTR